jgi:hypothetical protein
VLTTLCTLSMLTALTTTIYSDYIGLVGNDAYIDHHADDIHAWYAALAANHPGYLFERYGAGTRREVGCDRAASGRPSMVCGHE